VGINRFSRKYTYIQNEKIVLSIEILNNLKQTFFCWNVIFIIFFIKYQLVIYCHHVSIFLTK